MRKLVQSVDTALDRLERMPLVNSHATALQQDRQKLAQQRWLRAMGFRDAREAQNAGF